MNIKLNRQQKTTKLSKKQQEALDAEIKRQIAEKKNEFLMDMDAMILYSLHKNLGLGKKRLTEFFKTFIDEYEKFIDDYKIEGPWMAAYRLKETTGLDIEELHKEMGL